MFTIRLVTTIVHTILVVCTVIRHDMQDQGIAENTTLANTGRKAAFN